MSEFYSNTKPEPLSGFCLEYNLNQLSYTECGMLIAAFMRKFPTWSLFVQQRIDQKLRGNHILYVIRNYSSVDRDDKISKEDEQKFKAFVEGFISALRTINPEVNYQG